MKIKIYSFTLLFIICSALSVTAQVEYRSKGATGNWTALSTWEINDGAGNWSTPTSLPGTSTNSLMTIRSGHTVTVNDLVYFTNLVVEEDATILGETTKSMDLRNGCGTAPYCNDVSIINNGLINAERAFIAPYTTLRNSLTISGIGTTKIGGVKPRGGNLNPIEIIIDQDIDILATQGISNFSLFENSPNNKTTDNYTMTINAGKTVKIANNSPFHLHTNAINAASIPGKYTYNIAGTLDLNFPGLNKTTYLFPFKTVGSKVVLNVTGQLILGKEFITVNDAPTDPSGTLELNINGGTVDASAITAFTMGTSYFKLNETGKMKRLVGNTDIDFPVGTASSYNPVVINNTGTESVFTVGLKSTFDHPLSDATKAVDKQWEITAATPGTNATLKLGWLDQNEGASFNNSSDVAIIRHNGTNWEGTLATLDGSGTVASPRRATASAFTEYGIFGIQNYSTLPLKLLSFEGKSTSISERAVAVLKWSTVQEINTKEFLIQRKTSDKDFETIGVKSAVNQPGINYYSFSDHSVEAGANYYRLKQVDINGDFTYSNVIALKSTLNNLISFYPNPVKNALTIQYGSGKPATIDIMGINGNKIHSQSITESTTISLSHLKPGSYILSLKSADNVSVAKFIKE